MRENRTTDLLGHIKERPISRTGGAQYSANPTKHEKVPYNVIVNQKFASLV